MWICLATQSIVEKVSLIISYHSKSFSCSVSRLFFILIRNILIEDILVRTFQSQNISITEHFGYEHFSINNRFFFSHRAISNSFAVFLQFFPLIRLKERSRLELIKWHLINLRQFFKGFEHNAQNGISTSWHSTLLFIHLVLH